MAETLVIDKTKFEIPVESRTNDVLKTIAKKNQFQAQGRSDAGRPLAYSETYAEHSNSYSVAWL